MVKTERDRIQLTKSFSATTCLKTTIKLLMEKVNFDGLDSVLARKTSPQ